MHLLISLRILPFLLSVMATLQGLQVWLGIPVSIWLKQIIARGRGRPSLNADIILDDIFLILIKVWKMTIIYRHCVHLTDSVRPFLLLQIELSGIQFSDFQSIQLNCLFSQLLLRHFHFIRCQCSFLILHRNIFGWAWTGLIIVTLEVRLGSVRKWFWLWILHIID